MITLFKPKEKTFVYTEAQMKVMAKGIEEIVQKAMTANANERIAVNISTKLTMMLFRIHDCYPHVFDECIPVDELKEVLDMFPQEDFK
jgi:hypothetical protein